MKMRMQLMMILSFLASIISKINASNNAMVPMYSIYIQNCTPRGKPVQNRHCDHLAKTLFSIYQKNGILTKEISDLEIAQQKKCIKSYTFGGSFNQEMENIVYKDTDYCNQLRNNLAQARKQLSQIPYYMIHAPNTLKEHILRLTTPKPKPTFKKEHNRAPTRKRLRSASPTCELETAFTDKQKAVLEKLQEPAIVHTKTVPLREEDAQAAYDLYNTQCTLERNHIRNGNCDRLAQSLRDFYENNTRPIQEKIRSLETKQRRNCIASYRLGGQFGQEMEDIVYKSTPECNELQNDLTHAKEALQRIPYNLQFMSYTLKEHINDLKKEEQQAFLEKGTLTVHQNNAEFAYDAYANLCTLGRKHIRNYNCDRLAQSLSYFYENNTRPIQEKIRALETKQHGDCVASYKLGGQFGQEMEDVVYKNTCECNELHNHLMHITKELERIPYDLRYLPSTLREHINDLKKVIKNIS